MLPLEGDVTMVLLHPEYVVDPHEERKAVILPMAEWINILEELDELEDLRLYDQVKASSQESITFEQALLEIEEGCV